jgi:glycosyltransferase involved in cell wall biosynthesis
MKVFIDATNIREGGGVTHLSNILKHVNESLTENTVVTILGSRFTLNNIPDRRFIVKEHKRIFESNYFIRAFWLVLFLNRYLRKQKADLLFAPGGIIYTNFRPVVAMSQNALLFETKEANRFFFSITYCRLLLLRFLQKKSFQFSDGFIFLSEYARDRFKEIGWITPQQTSPSFVVIPHGVEPFVTEIFDSGVKESSFSSERPLRIIYISIIDLYKHQDKVALAIAKLNGKGIFVEIHFVGSASSLAFIKYRNTIQSIDREYRDKILYHGFLNRSEQLLLYKKMDVCLFASSCENMPNIVLEKMSTGLPIVSSGRGPMPEILKDSAIYFDPESVDSIAEAITAVYKSGNLRNQLSKKSFELSMQYTWSKCANETFAFLKKFDK